MQRSRATIMEDTDSERVGGIALEFPANNNDTLSSPKVPERLRQRLQESKSPITAEEIESKLAQAQLRRQQFHELLSSKAKPKSRDSICSPLREEDLAQRIEAKLNAAQQKRLRILEKAQRRLARSDSLRQSAKTDKETRFGKERDELSRKVQLRVKRAETNRMLLIRDCVQRVAAKRDRAAHSLLQRTIRERKYKECIRATMYQKRAAAERKRMRFLEAEKTKARARILQVRRIANSVYSQRELERIRMKDLLEKRLKRAEKKRAEYLRDRRSLLTTIHGNTNNMQAREYLSRKLERCWRKFVRSRKTTFALAKSFMALDITKASVESFPFEQLVLKIESVDTIRTAKALLDRLESRYLISEGTTSRSSSMEDIDHLLKDVASTIRGEEVNTKTNKKDVLETVVLSRYQVRVFLCAFMILGHPGAVFSGREHESTLAESAANLIEEFELLIETLLHHHIQTGKEGTTSSEQNRSFKFQLEAFDRVWCSYLHHFIEWKDNDSKLLEEDVIRTACQLELSMIQASKSAPEGHNGVPTHESKAVQEQVTENQKIPREKLQNLSNNEGLKRLDSALTDVHSSYFSSQDSACSIASPSGHNLSSCQHASLVSSLTSVPTDISNLTKICVHRSDLIHYLSEKDKPLPSEEVDSSALSVAADGHLSSAALSIAADGHPSSAAIFVGENELLVNEIIHEHHHSSADILNASDEDQNSLKSKVRETMERAFWDGVMESMKEDDSDLSWILKLMKEVRDDLCDMSPHSWKQEIIETIDISILSQVLRSGNLDMDFLSKILEFALATLRKLSAPANDDELKTSHNKFLKELREVLQAEDKSKACLALAVVEGLRFVLQQVQAVKREINKARLRIVEPLIKGSAGLEYLKKAFAKRHGSPIDAPVTLPMTRQWLLSVKEVAEQEWHEYTNSLSTMTSNEGFLSGFPTTLRTGAAISFETNSQALCPPDIGKEQPDCNGERVDLFLRLGLLKLVSEVGGVTLEALPETLKLNLSRLRAIQSQLQKIIVISTCFLVLRQTLLSENLVTCPEDMENIVSTCVKQLTELLDTVENVGIPEIVETIIKTENSLLEKLQARKPIIASMLGKSLQAGDAVFERVSHAVYLAARGVVLGGSGVKGRALAEASLRRIGAAMLTDNLAKAVEVLVVVAFVSVNVHRSWYEEVIKKN